MSPPLGLYADISHDAYHGDSLPDVVTPTLSASLAHVLVTESPYHAWRLHPKLGGRSRGSTAAMDRGSLLHLLLLGKGQDIVTVAADDWRTKASKEARDAAHLAGKIAVLEGKYSADVDKAKRVTLRFADLGLKLDGDSEVTAIWSDDGVLCRSRFDHLKEGQGIIYDLKTCETANPGSFARSCIDHGYDVQVHAYHRALETLRPDLAGRIKFAWLLVEKDTDEVAIYTPDASMQTLGRQRWNRARVAWAACLKAGQWPGYPAARISAPEWALAAEMGAQLTGGSDGIPF